MGQAHVIHSRNGCLGGQAGSSTEELDQMVAALAADPRRHLVLHFHGGLVSRENAVEIAQNLHGTYSPAADAGGFPLFFAWQSGAWETIRNNLNELADEPVFHSLLAKVLRHALKQTAADAAFAQLKGLDMAAAVPGLAPGPAMFAAAAGVALPDAALRSAADVDELEIEADLRADPEFRAALASSGVLAQPSVGRYDKAMPPSAPSRVAEILQHEFAGGADKLLPDTWLGAAIFIGKVVRAVLRRHAAGRGHGPWATCIEELVRAIKVAGSGVNEWGKALEWNRMKQDCRDAFGAEPDRHAGTALLSRLKQSGVQLERITLVGHSTGSIYIQQWLEHSGDYLPPGLKQDVVFLAPAITYDEFAASLQRCGQRIGRFRMFAMQDDLERRDQLLGKAGTHSWLRFAYPSSLLYLVSGVLESSTGPDGEPVDEPDRPLLGLQRYWHGASYGDAAFPSIKAIAKWFDSPERGIVWSPSSGKPAGFNCTSEDHGDFDNDPQTLDSLRQIVTAGF